MRFTIGSIAATILMAGVIVSLWPDGRGNLATPAALAQQAEQEKPAAGEPRTPDPNEETWARLQKPAQADFIDAPLGDVLDYLADVSTVQFYVDRNALEDVGVDSDSAINLSLKDVPVEMLLRLALRQLDLTYTLDHGVVIVTSPEEAEMVLIIRVYPVADLLKGAVSIPSISPEDPFGSVDPIAPFSESQSGRGGGFFSVVDEPAGEDSQAGSLTPSSSCQMTEQQPPRPTAVSSPGLVDLITTVVEPSSWDGVGGPGSICVFDQSLVISQTWQVHRKIETLLADLRRAAVEQPK